MTRYLAATLLMLPASVSAQAVGRGEWTVTFRIVDLTSRIVDLTVPGFLVRMARGRSTAEHKQVAAGQGIEALLAPDPKAHCRVDSQSVADGRYAQALTCPQKRGEPMHVARSGTYDPSGFVGRATVSGTTPKGAMTVILDQRAVQVGVRARQVPDGR